MIVDSAEIERHASHKRFAVVFFNKDARSFLRALRAGICAFPFSVEYLVDPTLAYRPHVRDLATSVISSERIVTHMGTLEELARARAFDAVLVFEGGYEDQPQAHLLGHDSGEVSSLADLEAKCRADYAHYVPHDPNAEFNARWSKHCVRYWNRFFAERGILVFNAYNIVLPNPSVVDRLVLNFAPRHSLLPTLPESLSRVPVRFVLGEDWACGKTSYLIERMREGASGIAGDFWFRFVSPEAIPAFRMQDLFGIKGVIANLIRLASLRNPGQPVFVKYDGRIEEFVFGIPLDRTFLVRDMHHYFEDCRFVIVHKSDSRRMHDYVNRFAVKYGMDLDRIDRVMIGRDGVIADLGPLPR